MKIHNLVLGTFCFLIVAGNIHAASFDCGKAASEVEKMICSNDELSKLDESLNKAYLRVLKRNDIKKQTIERQRQWLKNERNSCRDAECLKKAYESRIGELESQPDARADEEDEDIYRSLSMTCDYSDYKTFQYESVSITQTKDDQGKPAAVKRFKRGSTQQQKEIFIARPGEFCECIYPSGTRVRVKVGEGSSSPFGECGADPEVFMSLWVNERKIASKVWFAGHCIESPPRSAQYPAVSFKISGGPEGVSVQKCHTARQGESDLTPEDAEVKKGAVERLSVCVDYSDISKYPKDLVEYPPKGTETPKVGDIEMLYGSGAVCEAVLERLKRHFDDFVEQNDRDQSTTKLSSPNWSETSFQLHEEANGCYESVFDLNNDGKLDRVFSCRFLSHYRQGSTLLVQLGRSSTELMVDKVRHNIREFSPFSQENYEAGFSMKGRNEKDKVYFTGRYSDFSPFFFQGTTYIAVSSYSEDTKDYVAVLKPLPDGTFQKIGLFRRFPENF
jgi:uncharacterized protein